MNQPDPLEDLLRSTESWERADETIPEQLAMRVWRIHGQRTQRVTRLKISAALIGGFLAGLVTMKLILGIDGYDTTARPSAQSSSVARGELETIVDQEDPASSPRAETTAANVSQPQTVYARYCALGDEYLKRGGAIEAAAECYGLALDRATDDEMRTAVKDSWLLIALKKERREEV